MDISTIVLLLCMPVALGGILVLIGVFLTGFLSFKLKRDAGESFINVTQPKGDAFVIDDMLEGPAQPKRHGAFGTPFVPTVGDDVAAQILTQQTDKFLEQFTKEKAAEKAKGGL